MWKDFFYYSRSERRAVYVLLVLIALLLGGIWMLPEPELPMEVQVSKVDSLSIKKFRQEFPPKRKSYQLKNFNPNVADSVELASLGIPPYIVRNILKYRQRGGHFVTVESFSRIYGLSEEKFNELKPYIQIPKVVVKNNPKKDADSVFKSVRVKEKVFKYPKGTLVDVNLADTTELKKIPGIGSGIAKAIVSYRNRLGGFYSLEQLNEIEWFSSALMEWFKLEKPSVRQLNINEAGLDKLRAHPYLNFYQAKAIIEHRKKRGPIKNLSQLSLYEEFTEKDLKRLSAYIRFD